MQTKQPLAIITVIVHAAAHIVMYLRMLLTGNSSDHFHSVDLAGRLILEHNTRDHSYNPGPTSTHR